jgi:hypothetical protein
MVDRVHQTWLNNAYKAQEAMVDVEELYFGSSLKVMYLLLLSGNMPDLWNPPAPKKYRITVQAEPAEAGTITVKPDAPEFSRGDTVTIRAAAHEQFAFTRWSGDTSSADSVLKIVVTKDIVIKAMFDKVALQFVPATTTPRMFLSPALHTEDKIRFSMPYAGEVSLGIYSLQGNLIAHPVNGYCKKGLYSLSISGVLSNGMYLVILQTASGNLSRKITIKR